MLLGCQSGTGVTEPEPSEFGSAIETTDPAEPMDNEGPSDATDATSLVCGNGILEEGEECDDGNDEDTDACLNNCFSAVCGDGVIWDEVEVCDDGELNGQGDQPCLDACLRIQNCPRGECRDELEATGNKVGDVMYDFELISQYGTTIRLYDFCDREFLVTLNAGWCNDCNATAP